MFGGFTAMRARLFPVALAVCIPAALLAQKGSKSDPTPTTSGAMGGSGGMKTPSSRDLADLNPASLLISKRKKIPLADSTVAQLKAIEKTITQRNASFFVTYDSIRRWTVPLASSTASTAMQPGFTDADRTKAAPAPSPAEQARMESSMRDLRALMGGFRQRRSADVTDALAPVPDAQKKAATDLLTQQDGELDRLFPGRP
jgi:hypothetical protein